MAMPDSAMKPTAAEIEKGISRKISAKTPPVNARGTPEKIISVSFIELRAKNNKPMISARVTGTTSDKRCDADLSF